MKETLLTLLILFSVWPAYGQTENLDDDLRRAALRGDINAVEKAIQRGADVNTIGKGVMSPLMGAAFGGHDDIVRFLYDSGAEIDLAFPEGETALFYASEKGHGTTVKYLLTNGAKSNIVRIVDGATPLIIASQNGYREVVASLVEGGANANARLNNGATSVILASYVGHLDVVKYLVEKKADISISVGGKTALEFAKERGHARIVSYLESVGASKLGQQVDSLPSSAPNTPAPQAQQKLKELGYKPGLVDGLFGAKSRTALKQYQRDNNFPQTGELDEVTAQALGVMALVSRIEYKWREGYLEKDYAFDMKSINNAEFKWSKGWLSIQLELIDDGYIRLYGVGNEAGVFGGGKGGNVRFKAIRKGERLISVGIKIGNGDRKASKILHTQFQKILISNNSGN